MSLAEKKLNEADTTRRKVFIVIGLITALLVAGVVYLTTRRADTTPGVEPRLEGALRPGDAEFEKYREQIRVEFIADDNAVEGKRAIGDIVMTLTPTVRNLSNRTLTGLELRAAVVDLEGKPVKERTVIVIPTRRPELEPNRTLQVPISLEGFKEQDIRANARVDLTGVIFK